MTSPKDFIMTYPCYIPLRPDGSLYMTTARGDTCVPLFTDDDLCNRFFEDIAKTQRGRLRSPYTDAETLAKILREIHNSRIATHVIVDPRTQALQSRVLGIKEFATHIEAE